MLIHTQLKVVCMVSEKTGLNSLQQNSIIEKNREEFKPTG